MKTCNEKPGVAGIRAILDNQRAAFLASEPYSAEQRIDLLGRAIGLLIKYEKDLIEALTADFGVRSPMFSRGIDVLASVDSLQQAQAELVEWMKPQARNSELGPAWVQYQPLGVVGIVTPWNGPVNMIFNGLAGALAAGNRVMIKPSELTPRTSELMAQMIRSVYAEEEVAMITGGPDVAAAFCSQPFDHLMFTGSSSVGKQVMRAAAENLTPVTLELGGKSPTIISRSADFTTAVAKTIGGKMLNSGQLCVSPDYVFVPEERVEEFVAIARAIVAQFCPTLKDNPEYTSVINARHFQRLHGLLTEARAAGVEVVELNPAGEDFSNQPFHKIVPTLLVNPDDALQVMQEEIFGPILPIKPYKTMSEVLAYINARPRPLALYYFGNDAAEEDFVLTRTCSGGVTLNDVIAHAAIKNLPFGGVGASGMGGYHGIDGFRSFSHGKAIFRAGTL